MKADGGKKKESGVGGNACQHVLGCQISQGAQVSEIKDVENGIKNIHGAGFLEDSGRCYQHKDTLTHARRHTFLSAVCGAAVQL